MTNLGRVYNEIGENSFYGELEITKYLYESGLQNIFRRLSKSMSVLSHKNNRVCRMLILFREVSKKYLGEYTSNVGLGDVSDSLLDIYGKYQQNLEIFAKVMMQCGSNLTQEYNKAREENDAQFAFDELRN